MILNSMSNVKNHNFFNYHKDVIKIYNLQLKHRKIFENHIEFMKNRADDPK